MIPVLLKNKFRSASFWSSTKSLLTVHNMAFQGVFPREQYLKIGLENDGWVDELLMYGQVNFLKAGLVAADAVNTVSPQYAMEVRTPEFGCGLHEVVNAVRPPLIGILNGIDYNSWNATTDTLIERNFSLDDVACAKDINKESLQRELCLPVDARLPLFGFVGRLSHQKGMDVFLEALPSFLSTNAQWVIQGQGERAYESAFLDIVGRHPDKIVFSSDFCERLAHRIFAASDFFMMPSVFEPCGLTQMISMAYASLPIAHRVGGLKDTIKHYGEHGIAANGFGFEGLSVDHILGSVEEAVSVYRAPSEMACLRRNAMTTDFSWKNSAANYRNFYECLLSA
jgi:starch synthase